jgi:hypothetical protein
VRRSEADVEFPGGAVAWSLLEEIATSPNGGFEIGARGVREVRVFSEQTQ